MSKIERVIVQIAAIVAVYLAYITYINSNDLNRIEGDTKTLYVASRAHSDDIAEMQSRLSRLEAAKK